MATTHTYSIAIKDAAAHLFEVRLTVDAPASDGQVFEIPAWIPGSYMIRDYARNVTAARAESDGLDVELSKLDKSRWRAAPVERPLTLVLEVFAWDDSVRGAHLDRTHAYFNGPCVFPLVVGQQQAECSLEIVQPADKFAKDWRVATSMRRDGAQPYGFGRYIAGDYAELIDHPVEIGELNIGEFEASGIPHAIAIRGQASVDMARLCRDLQTLCEHHLAFLGAPDGLDRYVFLLNAPGKGYGGLEHRWSSSLVCARDCLPRKGLDGVDEGYRTFLGLVSHEYFHLWNIKRMKPAAFTPYDLSTETHTALLWVFEGITSYYDDLALLRSGLITETSYLELLGRTITSVLRGAGRGKQSIADSSFDAWTKFYKQDANARNAIVSYYAKGSLVALCLDLKLRSETGGKTSLDDVMRACWQRWGQSGEGMPEHGFEAMAEEVSGLDLADFFDATVRGTGELPLESLLQTHGVAMHLRAAANRKDKGGKRGQDEQLPAVWFGADINEVDGNTVFTVVHNGGPAEAAGVAPGDRAVALDGLALTADNFDERVSRCRVNDRKQLVVFRGDALLTLTIRFQEAPATTCFLELVEDVELDVETLRAGWLTG
ncbi:MAG: PDZ domain-containing protein [Woeseiaceae bacterium]|nr:PDZ domain-containing protein [Woeseiaceae bacterium]